MRVSVRLLAVALLAAFGLAACDTGDDRLSEEEYRTRLVAECQEANERFETFEEEPPPEEFADVLGEAADDIGELEPPEDLEEEHDDFVTALRDSSEAFQEAADAPPDEQEEAMGQAFASFGPAEQAAEPLGLAPLETCGEEPETEEPAAGSTVVEVEGDEYEFRLDGTVPSGPVFLQLDNVGEENHELAAFRIAEGATAQEIIDAEREGGDVEEFILDEDVGYAFARPGEASGFNAELTPGTYAFACFVTAPDGEPHAFKGMHLTVTVDGAGGTTDTTDGTTTDTTDGTTDGTRDGTTDTTTDTTDGTTGETTTTT